jgi:hypothetical protein
MVAALGVVAGGCGGAPAGAAGSGLPGDALVGMLNAEQTVRLCDWMAQVRGGYGRLTDCTNGPSQSTNSSQEQCVRTLPDVNISCAPLTVADVEGCFLAMGTDLCQFNTLHACYRLRICFAVE